MAPTGTRLPLPWPVLSAIAGKLVERRQPLMALAAILAADAYLRPGELLWLNDDDVVPGHAGRGKRFDVVALRMFPEERGRPSKTMQFQDSVLLDSPHRRWLSGLVLQLSRGRQGLQLFDFKYPAWLKEFKAAASELGLDELDPVLHLLRRTGPSDDYLGRRRSLEDIQRRGRWSAASCVRRYE